MPLMMVGLLAATDARAQARARDVMFRAEIFHIGYVHTPGWNYKLLDQKFYARHPNGQFKVPVAEDMTIGPSTRFILRAIASLVLVPLPWTMHARTALAYTPELIVWYVLVVLAAVGWVSGLRTAPLPVAIIGGVILCSAVALGLTSGNAGILVRHRSVVLVLVPWLSALGARELLAQLTLWGSRRRARLQTVCA